jgi:predicted phosphate transport protein (TIGR00153 family)
MRFRLIPRDESFYPLFEDQADRIASTAIALQGLVTHLPVTAEGVRTIVDAERAGDAVTEKVRQQLEKSIVTPFDREDIQALANHLDDVLDEMRAVADHLHLHNISAPISGVSDQLALLVKASERNIELVRSLRTLKGVGKVADDIERIESEADGMYRRVTAELFNGNHDALEILRWKDIVEAVESAIDAIEDTSDVIQFIAVKHA